MIEIHLAKNIKFLRKRQKLSQTELGMLIGLSRSNIASYESANAEPSATKLARMARHFNISLNQLIETDISQLPEEDLIPAHAIYSESMEERIEKVDEFEEKSSNLRKMTEGFRAFYQLKISQLNNLPSEVNSISTDFENLLNVMDNLVASNEEMLDYMKNSHAQ